MLTAEEKVKLLKGIMKTQDDSSKLQDISKVLDKFADEPEHEEQKFFIGQTIIDIDSELYVYDDEFKNDKNMKSLYSLSPTSTEYINLLFSIFGDAKWITIDRDGLLIVWLEKPNIDINHLVYDFAPSICSFHVTLPPYIDWKDCIWERPKEV